MVTQSQGQVCGTNLSTTRLSPKSLETGNYSALNSAGVRSNQVIPRAGRLPCVSVTSSYRVIKIKFLLRSRQPFSRVILTGSYLRRASVSPVEVVHPCLHLCRDDARLSVTLDFLRPG